MTGSSLSSNHAPLWPASDPGASRNIHAQTPLFRNEVPDALPHVRHEPGLRSGAREISRQPICDERYFYCVDLSFTHSVLILSKTSDRCSTPADQDWSACDGRHTVSTAFR